MSGRHRARLAGVADEAAAHGVAFGLALFAGAKVLRTMFTLPSSVWDTPVGELNGTFATWAYFGAFPALSIGLAVTQIAIAGLILSPRTRLIGALLAAAMCGSIAWLDLWLGIAPGLYVALGLLLLCVVLLFGGRAQLARAWRALRGEPRLRGPRSVAAFVTLSLGLAAMAPIALDNHRRKHALDGAWEVQDASGAGIAERWETLYFELTPVCSVRVGGALVRCRYEETDSGELLLSFEGSDDAAGVTRAVLGFSLVEPDGLVLAGSAVDGGGEQRPLRLRLHRRPVPESGRPY